VIVGVGLTVIVKVKSGPAHPFSVGLTVMVELIGAFVLFAAAVKLGMFPFPDAASPIAVFEFVHAKVVPGIFALKGG